MRKLSIGPDEWLYLNSIGFLFWTGSQWSSVNMGVIWFKKIYFSLATVQLHFGQPAVGLEMKMADQWEDYSKSQVVRRWGSELGVSAAAWVRKGLIAAILVELKVCCLTDMRNVFVHIHWFIKEDAKIPGTIMWRDSFSCQLQRQSMWVVLGIMVLVGNSSALFLFRG